jgi:hypothetical protein
MTDTSHTETFSNTLTIPASLEKWLCILEIVTVILIKWITHLFAFYYYSISFTTLDGMLF